MYLYVKNTWDTNMGEHFVLNIFCIACWAHDHCFAQAENGYAGNWKKKYLFPEPLMLTVLFSLIVSLVDILL